MFKEISVFGVSDQARHKLGFTDTEDGKRLEISVLKSKRIILCINGDKAYGTTDLHLCFCVCKCRFSHDKAHVICFNFTESYRNDPKFSDR